jgi:hypothetical protein
VEGELDADGFAAAALAEATRQGRAFDPRRWYGDDLELVHSQGRTHAITNQWGNRTGEALEKLVKEWPDRGIGIEVTA